MGIFASKIKMKKELTKLLSMPNKAQWAFFYATTLLRSTRKEEEEERKRLKKKKKRGRGRGRRKKNVVEKRTGRGGGRRR